MFLLFSVNRCDAVNFCLSKSNKKLLKRFNMYLKNGSRAESKEDDSNDHDMNTKNGESFDISESSLANAHRPNVQQFDVNKIQLIANNLKKTVAAAVTAATASMASTTATAATTPTKNENTKNDLVELTTENESDSTNIGTSDSLKRTSDHTLNKCEPLNRVAGPDPTKPLRKKAKLLRAERKKEKQQTSDEKIVNTSTKENINKKPANQEATLRSLFESAPNDGLHKIKVILGEKFFLSIIMIVI